MLSQDRTDAPHCLLKPVSSATLVKGPDDTGDGLAPRRFIYSIGDRGIGDHFCIALCNSDIQKNPSAASRSGEAASDKLARSRLSPSRALYEVGNERKTPPRP